MSSLLTACGPSRSPILVKLLASFASWPILCNDCSTFISLQQALTDVACLLSQADSLRPCRLVFVALQKSCCARPVHCSSCPLQSTASLARRCHLPFYQIVKDPLACSRSNPYRAHCGSQANSGLAALGSRGHCLID